MLSLLSGLPPCLQGCDPPQAPMGKVGKLQQDLLSLRPQLPSGIRHPEELSLLRAPEKKEKKKKEKEPEEELYDLSKVVLAGGECR